MARRIGLEKLSLKQWMHRNRILQLYQGLLRSIYRIPDVKERQYYVDWASKEFKTYKTMNEETDNYTINLKIQEAHGWQSQFEKLKKRTSDGFEQKKGAENAITSEKGTLNNYKKD